MHKPGYRWVKILKNRLNRENQKKKITEKTETWKKLIKILKKSTDSVWFCFYKSKIKKTEPKPKQKKTGKNQAKPVWSGFVLKKPNRTEIDRFEPVSVFFKKIFRFSYFFLIKTEPKMITPKPDHLDKLKCLNLAPSVILPFFFFNFFILK